MTQANPFNALVVAIPFEGDAVTQLGSTFNNVWEAVLNIGGEDGVEAGQNFVIFGLGTEIRDPISGQSLGHFEIVRGRGVVSHVQAKQCRIKSTLTRTVPIQPQNALATFAGSELLSRTEFIPFPELRIGDFARRV